MKVAKALLVSGVAAAMLAGCGNNNNGNASPSASAGGSTAPAASGTASASASASAGSKVTIKYYSWDNGKTKDQVDQIIANFENEHPEIDVVNEPLVTNGNSTDYYKKLDLIAASGDPIDVAAFSHVDFLSERAARGVLIPIDEYLTADGINADEDYYMTPKYDGKVYGLQDLSSPWLVALNKDALDAANLPVPTWGWTWDDFRDYAKKLTKGSGDDEQYGAFFHTWGEYANPIAYSELPHPYLTQDHKPVFDDKSFTYFFNLRRTMEKDDKSAKTYSDVIGGKLRYDSEFFGGKAAMIPTATFIVNLALDTEKFPHNFKTVFAPLPAASKDTEIGTSYIGGHYLAVGQTSQHKKESYEFLKYMAQQTDVIRDFPGSKKADQSKVLSALVGDKTNLIDTDSLAATVFDKRIKTIYDPSYSTAYSSQLKTVLENGLATFLLDNLSAEDAEKQMIDEANKIIGQNK